MLLSPSFCRTRDWPSGVIASLPAARITTFNSVFVARSFDIDYTFHAPASSYDAGQLLHRKSGVARQLHRLKPLQHVPPPPATENCVPVRSATESAQE